MSFGSMLFAPECRHRGDENYHHPKIFMDEALQAGIMRRKMAGGRVNTVCVEIY
jgi:hypothetical protein